MKRRRRVAALLALLLIAAILTSACVSESVTSGSRSYIGNTKTHVFHKTSCSYLPTANRVYLESRSEAIQLGYRPCQKCRP